jgi:TonB family protein
MTATLLLDNVLAWSAQVAVLVAVGALAAFTLAHPRARLIFWQGILAIALLLPAVEPFRQPVAENTGSVAIAANAAPVISVRQPAFHFIWKREYLLLIIAAGAALRLLWIGAGLVRLRRHRLDAQMLTIPPVRFSNPRVRWFVSSTVGGPVTFGFLNPSILLPARVVALPDDLREAIAHHELAHVRRRDWLFVLLEEAIRSVCWFHPAVWFVLSRIQLAREQVVDAEVVGLTHDRERYLDALVAVAAQRLLPDVAPAPLFLKKRQLAVRVAAVLKETPMSKPRTFLSFTTVCSAAFLAARLAIWMFPMQAPAQTVQASPKYRIVVKDGPGVLVEPGAAILHRPPVFYPSGVTMTGTVIVESSVNAKGEVTDAHVVSGPDALRSAVLMSVLNWHFAPEGLPPTVQSMVRFDAVPEKAASRVAAATEPDAPQVRLARIDTSRLPEDLAQKVSDALPVHVGDEFGNGQFEKAVEAVRALDEHLTLFAAGKGSDRTLFVTVRQEGARVVSGGAVEGLVGGVPGMVLQEQAATAPAVLPPPANGVERIRVGGNVQSMNLTRKVTPLYPPLAKQARIQGVVRFTALIGTDGSVINLQLVEGHPLLVSSAQEAVQQWQYKPTLLNGNPAEVVTQIDVNYTLSQ